jgi:hypothetical protein
MIANDKTLLEKSYVERPTQLKGVVEPQSRKREARADLGPMPASGLGSFPNFTYHGGPVLNTPQVYALFVGDWSSAANQNRAARLSQFIRDLLHSRYMNILAQYGCGTTGTLVNSVFVASPDHDLSATDIHTILQTAINNMTIPEPIGSQTAYSLILDDATAVNDTIAGAVMCENTSDTAFGYHDFFITSAGNPCYFSVIPGLTDSCLRNSCPGNDGTCSLHLAQTQEQRQTQVLSHELAEMFSDPQVGSNEAWTAPGSPHENGDICNGQTGVITVGANTWTVQLMYSKFHDQNSNGAVTCISETPDPLPSFLPAWAWNNHGQPPNTQVASTPAIAGWIQNGVQRFNVFFQGANGNLLEMWWDGQRWVWTDHGQPPNTQVASAPAIAGWIQNGVQRFNVFFQGANGNLLGLWWDGQKWQWNDQGRPPNTQVASAPAIVGWTQDGVQRLNVFFQGANGNLIELAWLGQQWQWGDHGQPPNTQVASAPAIVGWILDGVQRINVLFHGANGNLIQLWWNGQEWAWKDHGQPPNTQVASASTIVGWIEGGVQRLNAFFRGANGNLMGLWWDGGQWQWNDQGQPPNTQVASAPAIVGWIQDGVQRFNVFFQGVNGNLIELWWNGQRWQWNDHGQPPNTQVASAPAIAGWIQGRVQRFNVFFRGADGSLSELWWS